MIRVTYNHRSLSEFRFYYVINPIQLSCIRNVRQSSTQFSLVVEIRVTVSIFNKNNG